MPSSLGFDPFQSAAWIGLILPVLVALVLRSDWVPAVKTWVTIALAITATLFVWWASSYPANWRLLATVFAEIYAASQIVYYVLKPTGALTWLEDMTTPGYTARHARD